ncbi:hypothetical protein QVD17_26409 [Tagetes erecta]|uniref:Uncharacterized protein n=1 Tax=Tagetes erecta TaxID=13708 RepID=A0AAD8K7D0_TARER|nr:hypothetical protein QVD17_26409 [Tagetes erecta]
MLLFTNQHDEVLKSSSKYIFRVDGVARRGGDEVKEKNLVHEIGSLFWSSVKKENFHRLRFFQQKGLRIMSQSPHYMDSDAMLDIYIYDYLTKRKLNASRKVFGDEAKVPANFHAIDAPRGFLFEWWTVFWDIFVSRYRHNQGCMEPCNEGFRVPQQQRQQQGSQHQSQSVNNATGKNTWVAEASTPTSQAVPKQWCGDNVAMLMNHINSINHQPIEHQKQSLDINSMMNSLINQRAQGSEGLPSGAHAIGALNNLPLKGWPLTGQDQIRTRFHQQQSMVHPPPLSYQGHIEGQNQPPNECERSQTVGQLHPQMEKKRKHPLMSSSVATGATNVIGGFSNSAETSLPHSPHNEKINIDDFLNYGALDGNDNSLLPRTGKESDVDTSNDFTFLEVGSVHAASVNCCDISFDGKLVAVGGKDKKARLWCTSSLETKATLDEHSQAITDIRFSPSMRRLATSSQDKTLKIWDLENPGCSIKTFTGHTASVMSLDFHPKKEDLICSCDETEIRYWNIKSGGCVRVSKGGANLVRFQSGVGKHIASVIGKSVSLSDLENPLARKHILKGHGSNVESICWDCSGEHLISVSEDLIKVWRMDLGGKANCMQELSVPGKRFHCGIFHPCYPSLLVIGCHQSMELWNMTENKILMAVEEPVSELVVSNSGIIASAGHNDNVLKLWK